MKNYEVYETLSGMTGIFYDILEVLRKKNKLYGDSWKKYGEKFSIFPNIARKFDRLENIILNDEGSPRDKIATVFDLTGYCLLYLELLKAYYPEEYVSFMKKERGDEG